MRKIQTAITKSASLLEIKQALHEHYNMSKSEYDSAPCRYWPFAVDGGGYPTFGFGSATLGVTRFICQIIDPRTDSEQLVVMHKCDTPICIAPWHLKWGTPSENLRDRDDKGRRKARADNILERDAELWRKYSDEGMTPQQLSIKYNKDLRGVRRVIAKQKKALADGK